MTGSLRNRHASFCCARQSETATLSTRSGHFEQTCWTVFTLCLASVASARDRRIGHVGSRKPGTLSIQPRWGQSTVRSRSGLCEQRNAYCAALERALEAMKAAPGPVAAIAVLQRH
jgi:hypothetical protein